ncbi:hypothetical protein [Natronosalvus halobius]|uniref:hypothetical protein n=1 Tax=Natronosalvus halobius TaxID=2953746 RepID=UPI0020A2272B|nr:hypothetical protein [Natronosalvus halobius]USZ73030.1 hypothetical protein NGM15_06935 [Natronosalvus halobius]
MDFDRLAGLDVRIDDVELRRLERDTSSEFTRVTTEVAFAGPGPADDGPDDDRDDGRVTGRGEDVTYDAEEHDALHQVGLPTDDLEGEFTLASFSDRLEDLDLFPAGAPDRADFRDYRRWALESAALDLALRQAGTSLGDALDREPKPLRFVASTRLGEPPSTDRVEHLREAVPSLEFKLDPTPEWTDAVIEDLVETDAVRILDLKGQYEGTEVDVPADPEFYERILESFPEAVIEDPGVTEETRPLLEAPEVRNRLSWDAPIHGVQDVEALPWESRWLNVKPSRFGSLESLLETIAYCEERGIRCYGGGQFELGVGRGQIQLLAALYYPDGPNDVAPGVYNDPEVADGLPPSPLEPPADDERVGFRW